MAEPPRFGKAAPRIGLMASPMEEAQAAARRLDALYDWVPVEEAELIVVLGGDGFMLQAMHANMARRLPLFGMNRGTVGFLMNEYSECDLLARLERAERFELNPLSMSARTVRGELVSSPAFNEVSLLRQTRQAARLEIAIDGRVRMPELVSDGVLVATPAGSSAYNLSAHGPILPLGSELLALTPISAFRPRRWRGALLPLRSTVEFRVLDPDKRPVSAVADQFEVRDVALVRIVTDVAVAFELWFDPGHTLADRIWLEQFIA